MPTKVSSLGVDLNSTMTFLYGRQGVGKTPFAATWPKSEEKPLYFMDFDDGLTSIIGHKEAGMMEFDQFLDEDRMKPHAWEEARRRLVGLSELGRKGKFPYSTVVLDGIWSLTGIMYNSVREVTGSNKELAPEIRDHQALADRVEDIFRMTRAWPCHVVMISQEMIIQDERTSEMYGLPMVPGQKLPHRLPTYFDNVWRMTVEFNRAKQQDVISIYTRPNRYWTSRTRLRGLDRTEEFPITDEESFPTFEKLMSKVRKHYEGGGAEG